ncbi:MAG: hypothetical protein ACI94Y_002648 [Maribacter sp.]|jgi:hypothetical protein
MKNLILILFVLTISCAENDIKNDLQNEYKKLAKGWRINNCPF